MKRILFAFTLLLSLIFFADPTFAYSVKKGDTMTNIALENNLTLKELAKINPQIQNLDLIYEGDTVNTVEIQKTVSSIELDYYLDSEMNRLAIFEQESEELAESSSGIQKNVSTVEPPKKKSSSVNLNYSDYEIDLLARLVRAEAQIEPFKGKIAVACVVLNRVESSAFPDTIKEVIYERGQFQPVSNGEINKPADSESIAAVYEALTVKRNTAKESLFFYNPDIATSRWLDSRSTALVIGQHVFKY